MVKFGLHLFGVEGISAMWRMYPQFARAELMQATREAGEEVRRQVKRLTPRSHERKKRGQHLQDSYQVRVNRRGENVQGTVESKLPYLIVVEYGAREHDIAARNRQALMFIWHGQKVFFKRVHHPGFAGKHMMRDGVEAAKPRISRIYQEAMERVRQRAEAATRTGGGA